MDVAQLTGVGKCISQPGQGHKFHVRGGDHGLPFDSGFVVAGLEHRLAESGAVVLSADSMKLSSKPV